MDIPTWLQALVLGVVQGVTEFIPVSSSAHLVLVPSYLGWQRGGLAFDVALHGGTLLALIVYYQRDLWGIALATLGVGTRVEVAFYRRLGFLVVIATVPVAVAGLLLRPYVEVAFMSPRLASALLLATAMLLTTGECVRRRRVANAAMRAPSADPPATAASLSVPDGVPDGVDDSDPAGSALAHISMRQALSVGFAQILALLPGVSRSGTTITAGLVAGLTRPAATRFAFLMALPAIAGATVVNIGDLSDLGPYSASDLVVGMIASAIAGYAAITYLVRLVARAGLQRFVVYLVVVALIGLVVFD